MAYPFGPAHPEHNPDHETDNSTEASWEKAVFYGSLTLGALGVTTHEMFNGNANPAHFLYMLVLGRQALCNLPPVGHIRSEDLE